MSHRFKCNLEARCFPLLLILLWTYREQQSPLDQSLTLRNETKEMLFFSFTPIFHLHLAHHAQEKMAGFGKSTEQ